MEFLLKDVFIWWCIPVFVFMMLLARVMVLDILYEAIRCELKLCLEIVPDIYLIIHFNIYASFSATEVRF